MGSSGQTLYETTSGGRKFSKCTDLKFSTKVQNAAANLLLLHTMLYLSRHQFNFAIKANILLFLLSQFATKGTNALQCYHCGTDPAVQKPILLGALTRDPSYDYDAYEVPTCNYFNTSLSEYVITCQPDEKGCLKGWVTQEHLFCYWHFLTTSIVTKNFIY